MQENTQTVTKTTAAPKPQTVKRKIGKTTYELSLHFSQTSTERIKKRVGEFERAICALSSFKYAKFGYLGHTYDGMYDMNTDPTAFARTFGCHVKMLEMCELAEYVNSATDAEVKSRIDDIDTKGVPKIAKRIKKNSNWHIKIAPHHTTQVSRMVEWSSSRNQAKDVKEQKTEECPLYKESTFQSHTSSNR